MAWAYQQRGLLLAVMLSIFGHVWAGFIWRAQVVPPELLSMNRDSTHVAMLSKLRGRLLSEGVDASAMGQQPASTAPLPAPLRDSTPEPAVPDVPAGLRLGRFVPSAKLDSPLVPMSAPDTSQLKGLYFSGQPIRLRLLVTATGHVAEVLILQAAPQDAEAVTHIQAMFLNTAYIPGQMAGKPVAAQLDIELQLD